MKVGIIGGGNGGLALASLLYKRGNEINLWNRSISRIAPIIEQDNSIIAINGEEKSYVKLNKVSDNLSLIVNDVEVIFIVTTSSAHEELGKILPPYVPPNVPILLMPGRTYGCVAYLENAEELFPNNKNICLEAQTLLHACRAEGNKVTIYGTKKEVTYSGVNQVSDDTIMKLKKLLPELHYSPNYLDIALNNVGAFFHPIPTLLNAGVIEGRLFFKYYSTGISKHVAAYIQRMDDEKGELCKYLGVYHCSLVDWLKMEYCAEGEDLYTCLQSVSAYKEIDAPNTLNHRYVYDDLLTGLIPILNTAKYFKVAVPTIETFIHFACDFMDVNYLVNGRDFPKMLQAKFPTSIF